MTGKYTLGTTAKARAGKYKLGAGTRAGDWGSGNTNAPAKCVFLEVFQNSQEDICVRGSL